MKNQNNKSCSVTVAEQSCCHAIRDARVASCDTAIDTSLAVSDSTSLLMQQSISIVDGAAQAALRREPFLDVVKHSRSEKIARFARRVNYVDISLRCARASARVVVRVLLHGARNDASNVRAKRAVHRRPSCVSCHERLTTASVHRIDAIFDSWRVHRDRDGSLVPRDPGSNDNSRGAIGCGLTHGSARPKCYCYPYRFVFQFVFQLLFLTLFF